MTVHLRIWQACEVIDCKRPAHLYGLCVAHWMSLSAMERKVLVDCEPTEPIDSLELAWNLTPTVEHPMGDAA